MIIKYSVILSGQRTSVSLEKPFWVGLKNIASAKGMSVHALIESIDERRATNRSSAIRALVLAHYMRQGKNAMSSNKAANGKP